MFGKPGGTSGVEMMLMNMFRSLGINPEQIGQLADGFMQGLKINLAQQQLIIAQNTAIMDHLGIQSADADGMLQRVLEARKGATNGGPGGSDDHSGPDAGAPGG